MTKRGDNVIAIVKSDEFPGDDSKHCYDVSNEVR
jgi:hypothetical protein